MSTIRQQLVNGYILNTDGEWVRSEPGRITEGGNVDLRLMLQSLEAPRLQRLATKRGLPFEQLLPEVVQATLFIGAYLGFQRRHQIDPTDTYVFENGDVEVASLAKDMLREAVWTTEM